jgi:hypothetical protein
VLLAGGVTSALALAGVYLFESVGANAMGLYVFDVVPLGSILVGLGASIGFEVAAWRFECKITGRLLWAMMAVLACTYGLSWYVRFRVEVPTSAVLDDGSPYSFWRYFDALARSFHWEAKGSAGPGAPFGALGYAMRGLELIGFVGGGLFWPLARSRRPYCNDCSRYMHSPLMAVVPMSATKQGKRSPTKTSDWEVRRRSHVALEALLTAARAGDLQGTQEAVAEHGPLARRADVEALSERATVHLDFCTFCNAGQLRASMATGTGSNERLRRLSVTPLDKSLVAGLLRVHANRTSP